MAEWWWVAHVMGQPVPLEPAALAHLTAPGFLTEPSCTAVLVYVTVPAYLGAGTSQVTGFESHF